MSRDRIELQPAWLLSQKPYRETSELLEVLTPAHGRVGLVARGMRGAKAKQRGVIAMFRPLLLSWLEKGDLGTVTAVEAGGPEIVLGGERLFYGWYLNELLLKLLGRHDPHPSLHVDYGHALHGLTRSAPAAEAALRIFEKRALEQLGYGLPLDEPLDADAHYCYTPERGFELRAQGARGAMAGRSLIALRDETLADRATLDDARRLLRTALEPLVPHASLRTPQLLRDMRAFKAAQQPVAPPVPNPPAMPADGEG